LKGAKPVKPNQGSSRFIKVHQGSSRLIKVDEGATGLAGLLATAL
jgi:hypothetical protein